MGWMKESLELGIELRSVQERKKGLEQSELLRTSSGELEQRRVFGQAKGFVVGRDRGGREGGPGWCSSSCPPMGSGSPGSSGVRAVVVLAPAPRKAQMDQEAPRDC